MFKKKKMVEVPLYYWEEKSYMMVIPSGDVKEEDILRNAVNGISSIEGVNVLENNYSVDKNCMIVKFEYEDEDYEVGYFVGGVSVPDYYVNSFLYTNGERQALMSAKKAVTIFMEFGKDVKKSYHLQLKLAVACVPDLIGVLDESAERMLPAKWVRLAADSSVVPSSKQLFTVQAVQGEDGKVWLHTHGLCRCGLTELEILESDAENQRSHYNLINTFAMYLIDHKGKYDPLREGAYIGQLINGEPVVATCRIWTEGILEYKKLDMGGAKDRKTGHNSRTSIIFLYTSEEDEKNGVLSKISIYDDVWGDNPIFFLSDEETFRMKDLAMERFDYFKKGFEDKDNQCLVKIGLPLEEKGKFEHIWFELLEVKGKKFKARLTQEPYYFDDIHEGYEAWYTVNDVTDWIIYTPRYPVTPDTAFLLDDEEVDIDEIIDSL